MSSDRDIVSLNSEIESKLMKAGASLVGFADISFFDEKDRFKAKGKI